MTPSQGAESGELESFDPSAATIVAVAFNRSSLLARLLTSIGEMDP